MSSFHNRQAIRYIEEVIGIRGKDVQATEGPWSNLYQVELNNGLIDDQL